MLGKVAVVTGPPAPELQHAALQLTTRGLETLALPAPNGSGAFSVALDLRAHEGAVEHSNGRAKRIPLTPNRSVGEITRAVLAAVEELAGKVEINMKPQEVAWETPLDEDEDHRTYDPSHVAAYFEAATRASLALAAYRAPYRGRSTPVNAWWGSFDLAVSLFSGRSAAPPSEDFIMRNAMDAQELATGWWPGDARHPKAAFYAYAHPAPPGYENGAIDPPAAHWSATLGEYVLDWDEVASAPDPHGAALDFLRSAARTGARSASGTRVSQQAWTRARSSRARGACRRAASPPASRSSIVSMNRIVVCAVSSRKRSTVASVGSATGSTSSRRDSDQETNGIITPR